MRQTSLTAYKQIQATGLLSKRRIQVLECMVDVAPCTAQELERIFNSKFSLRGSWKQLSHLRDQGVLYEVKTRTCNITGRQAIEWDFTGNLPIPVKKKKRTKPHNINKVIDYLIQGMDLRGWNSIDKSTLLKLKQKDVAKEKST